MKTAFWLLMEFIFFGLGVISCMLIIVGIVGFGQIRYMASTGAVIGMLLIPVVAIGMAYGFFKAYGAAARRRRGQYVLKRTMHRPQ